MKIKFLFFNTFDSTEPCDIKILSGNSLKEILSDNYTINDTHYNDYNDIEKTLLNGGKVVLDESSDKSDDPQFWHEDDWIIKIEIIEI
jgi:hypothetical protein